jgi:hypothetical protein
MHRFIFISSALLLIIWLVLAGLVSSLYIYLVAAVIILGISIYSLRRST